MFKERFQLFIHAFKDTRGLDRRAILDAVFFCPQSYVHSYYMLIEDLIKHDKRVA